MACASIRPLPPRDVFPIATTWSVEAGEGHIGGPLVSDGGRIFVASRDGRVTGLDRFTGATLWSVSGRPGVLAIGGGVLALREADGTVWVMDPDTGTTRWKAPSGVLGTLPVLIASAAVVVAGDGLAALEPGTGRALWTVLDAKAAVVPALAGAALVVGESDGPIRGRDLASGRVLWSHPTGHPLVAPPIADDRGRVLAGTTDRRFVALDAKTGKAHWTWRLGAAVHQPPVVFERLVLFATNEDVLYGLDRGNGHMRWRAALPSRPLSGPVLFGGAAIVACHGARPGETFLIAFDARTGDRLGDFKVPGEATTPPLLVEDRLYIGMRESADRVLGLRLGAAEAAAP